MIQFHLACGELKLPEIHFAYIYPRVRDHARPIMRDLLAASERKARSSQDALMAVASCLSWPMSLDLSFLLLFHLNVVSSMPTFSFEMFRFDISAKHCVKLHRRLSSLWELKQTVHDLNPNSAWISHFQTPCTRCLFPPL